MRRLEERRNLQLLDMTKKEATRVWGFADGSGRGCDFGYGGVDVGGNGFEGGGGGCAAERNYDDGGGGAE